MWMEFNQQGDMVSQISTTNVNEYLSTEVLSQGIILQSNDLINYFVNIFF